MQGMMNFQMPDMNSMMQKAAEMEELDRKKEAAFNNLQL